jgi:hypothetical protein
MIYHGECKTKDKECVRTCFIRTGKKELTKSSASQIAVMGQKTISFNTVMTPA